MAASIRACSCAHKYQDEKYGKSMKVHNKGVSKTPGSDVWVCSVCGLKKSSGKEK